MRLGSHPIRAYAVYLFLECGTSFLLGICYATITVYWVISGRLNPLVPMPRLRSARTRSTTEWSNTPVPTARSSSNSST